MNRSFVRNIDWRGRLVRGLGGLALLGGAVFCRANWPWLGLGLAMVGVFGLFQALRGWCLMRACGFKTRF
ncbi:MAG: hypothetical protein RLZZ522_1577 [Verrucomicrobiota bacterium]|jgi:hypothetical protein